MLGCFSADENLLTVVSTPVTQMAGFEMAQPPIFESEIHLIILLSSIIKETRYYLAVLAA